MPTSQPSLTSSASAPPWQERQLGYWRKLLVIFGFALLTLTALISGGTWVAIVPGMIIQGPGPRDTIGEMLTVGLLLTGLLDGATWANWDCNGNLWVARPGVVEQYTLNDLKRGAPSFAIDVEQFEPPAKPNES